MFVFKQSSQRHNLGNFILKWVPICLCSLKILGGMVNASEFFEIIEHNKSQIQQM